MNILSTAPRCSGPSLIWLALAAALGVSGCASVGGQQAPINMDDPADPSSCPTSTQIDTWEELTDPEKKAARRSRLIDDCVAAIDLKYEEFVRALRKETVGVNLGTDILALGLTTSAALSGAEEAKALAALSTGVAGAGTAIDKDLYYDKTMPALVAAMNANRNTILARIRQSENQDASYTPSRARRDLRDYAQAGSIDVAIAKVTAEASAVEQQSIDKLQDVFKAAIFAPDIVPRIEKLHDFIWDLYNAKDKEKLGRIAKALDLAPTLTLEDQRIAILDAINMRVSGRGVDQRAAMDAVVNKLSKVLGEKLDI